MGAIHSTKIPTGPTGKSGPPQKGELVFSKPVGANQSIECWTEISGNFGWMDRVLILLDIVLWYKSYVNRRLVTKEEMCGKKVRSKIVLRKKNPAGKWA